MGLSYYIKGTKSGLSLIQSKKKKKVILAKTSEHITSDECGQPRFGLACAFAQLEQNLHWAHFELPRKQSVFFFFFFFFLFVCLFLFFLYTYIIIFVHEDNEDSEQIA